MKYIEKKKGEPQSLIEFKSLANEDWKPSYKNLDKAVSQQLRERLYEEQGGVCCYCMGKLDIENSKIEHFLPQERFPTKDLDYQNLYLTCKGEEAQKDNKGKKLLYCDSAKGSTMIPAYLQYEKSHELFEYNRKGLIAGKSKKDKVLEGTIDLLGLNKSKTCIDGRQSVFVAFLDQAKKNINSLEEAVKFRESLLSKTQQPPYVGVILFLLETRVIPKCQ